jgi:hypothetical protein
MYGAERILTSPACEQGIAVDGEPRKEDTKAEESKMQIEKNKTRELWVQFLGSGEKKN